MKLNDYINTSEVKSGLTHHDLLQTALRPVTRRPLRMNYKFIGIWCTFLILSVHPSFVQAQETTGAQDRAYWVETLVKISDPVLINMSQGNLRKNMPVETITGQIDPPNSKTTHLEALGRLLAGMAPWLELGPDRTPEGQLRAKYIDLMVKSISQGFDPSSPDYLNFVKTRQPLVDAAFFCQGLLRAPNQIWGNLSPKTKQDIMNAMQEIRKIKPVESNWLLFSAMVEAAMLEFNGEWNQAPVDHALTRFKEWYKGDAWYGDGADLHMDFYNSFVIHPMLMDLLTTMQKHRKGENEFYELEKKRFTRYAEQLERFISPDGAYPVFGRSIAYRFGTFHVLSEAALMGYLPQDIRKSQVRCGLTAVIKKHMDVPGNFDEKGWLTLGFCGHQPNIAEKYISTGSLYLCSVAFVALGLPPADEFWTTPYAAWTGRKIWSGKADVKIDKAIKQ